MVRLTDLKPDDARHLLEKPCPPFADAWAEAAPAEARRVAIITTAGLHHRDDLVFAALDLGYRVIRGDVAGSDLVMTHSSVNYDRSGFQADVNVVFPIDRLRTLAKKGEIKSVAAFHYALNGAGWEPTEIEETARELAGLLKEDNVNAALLVPV